MKKIIASLVAVMTLLSTTASYAGNIFCSATCLMSDERGGAQADVDAIRTIVTGRGNSKAEGLEEMATKCQNLVQEYNKKADRTVLGIRRDYRKTAQLITSYEGYNSSSNESAKYDFNVSAACAE